MPEWRDREADQATICQVEMANGLVDLGTVEPITDAKTTEGILKPKESSQT